MSAAPEVGDVLLDKYRLERKLGEGGMGVVFEALHLKLEQRVALKFLSIDTTDNESLLKRFEREARAAASLNSEHIARVYDYGQLASGAPYIVMEYLQGKDAAELVEERGPLSLQTAVDVVIQAAVGLAHAHAAGIVHRDIKPANLFVAQQPDGRQVVKVLDFGISKLTESAEDEKLTRATTIGSPLYMSPEQIQGRRALTIERTFGPWALSCTSSSQARHRSSRRPCLPST